MDEKAEGAKVSPSECKSERDLHGLDFSHKSIGDFDLLIQHDQALIFTQQKSGEPVRASITIPKRTFLALMRWYDMDQPA